MESGTGFRVGSGSFSGLGWAQLRFRFAFGFSAEICLFASEVFHLNQKCYLFETIALRLLCLFTKLR